MHLSRKTCLQAPLTVFAPTDAAFTAAEDALGFDFATTTDTAQQDIVRSTLLVCLKH